MECGECTACCTVCAVPELNKKPFDNCLKCGKDCCLEYDTRPKSCRDFECAYYQGGNDIALRPDKCGVIFFKKNERIFCGLLVSGVKMTNIARGQIQSLHLQGYSVVMLKQNEKPHIILAKNHTHAEIYKEYTGILKEWQRTVQT